MKTRTAISVILMSILGLAAPAFGQGSIFYFHSDAQSVIGQGETVEASTTNGFSIVAQINNGNGVSLIISSETRYWFLDFSAAGNVPLAVGQYNNATCYPVPGGVTPGMLLSGEGRSVSTVSGYFNILAIEYGPGNSINRFDADFVQNDDGLPGQANTGGIRFNALNPVPEPGTIPLLTAALVTLLAMNWRRRKAR
ncbi:MAG: hypothetical protein QOF48_3259 [Verrucomicrobiota bacterium]|jgi:hypothetical protein